MSASKKGNNSRSQADFWTLKAKKEGYPARSVYKLQEIDQKFGLFRKGMRVLDVGCAPGSWSLYALRRVGPSGFVCGVDLKPISLPSGNPAVFYQGDAFDPEIRLSVGRHAPFQAFICDAAPSTTGHRLVDAEASFELVRQGVEWSAEVVAPNGFLVAKIFQGESVPLLVESIKALYADCKIFKPQACRKDSFECYLIGIRRLQTTDGASGANGSLGSLEE